MSDIDDQLAAKQAKKQEATDADAWDPAPGEKIVGVLLRADVVKTRRGPSLLLVVRNTGEESGGIDTNELSSKTMECKNQPGLYSIGEVVDVTGHLGGFNFQWAWSSGQAAGQAV